MGVKNEVKETKSIPDLSEKCNRLQQENERLIIELEKTSVQINVQAPVQSAKDDSALTGKLQAENERLIIELEKTQKSLNIEKEKSLTVISNQPPVESSKIEDSGVLGEDEYSSDSPTDSPKKSKGQKLVKGKVLKNIKDAKDEKPAESKFPPTPKVKTSSKSCQVIPVKVKSNTSSSQTRSAKTVTKGNQTKQKVSRCVNHSVQTMWTSEKIDLVKNELKKYKDQIQSEELKKLKKDLLAGRDKKDPEGGEEVTEDNKKTTEAEKPLTPSRGTMPSTSHQAVIIKHKSQTPSLKSTDDDLDKPSSSSSSDEEKPVFEEKEKKPVKKVLALKEMKEKEAKIDKLEDQ